MTKAIAIKTNSKGRKFALCHTQTAFANPDRTVGYRPSFGVFVLCSNYDGKVRGGMRQTWRYVEKDMTREAAEALFNRRVGR